MEITDSQEKEIKDQLLKQVENMPDEQKEQAKKQIEDMSKEDIAKLIEKNQANSGLKEGECIFCAINEGKSHSIKIDENDEAIAVMDINPISKGHVLVIPKDHDKEPTEKSQELAFSIGDRILKTLKPKDITTRGAKIMDHTILNVIPIYDDTDFEKRISVTESELLETAEKISEIPIEKKEVPKIESKKPEIPKENICIFCSIINNNTPSFKIDENKDNIAILEINPVSKGHAIIIPRVHADTTKIPNSAFTLAKKIAKKITTKYKPNDVKIIPTSVANHAIIEIIPIYDDTNPEKREKISEEELKKLQKALEKKEKKTTSSKSDKKETKKKTSHLRLKSKYPSLPQMRPRIP